MGEGEGGAHVFDLIQGWVEQLVGHFQIQNTQIVLLLEGWGREGPGLLHPPVLLKSLVHVL